MTIKQRLRISNILMILVPVGATALVGIVSVRLLWGLMYASAEEIRHYGPRPHTHPQMALQLFDGHGVFFGPGEAMGTILLILILTSAATILLTNRFLTKFVFRHIREPLDILSDGVIQIGQGNLEHRIRYEAQDEFAPVCQAFNEMASRLKVSVEQTQQNEENRKLLLAGLSHDLRSPLTSLRAYTEGLMDGVAETEADRLKYLKTIHRKTEEIDHLVSQVFTYSKLDLAAAPPRQRFRLDRTIVAFLQEHGDDYERRGLVLRTRLCPATIQGDRTMLLRILANLCENSLKYRSHTPAHMTLTLENRGDRCLFTASDDGPGVPEEALPSLFDVFYRGDKARQHPASGSGLGLSIVRRCAAQMGGIVWAENAESGGLCIRIELPLAEEERP